MSYTLTPNHSLYKPTPNADNDAWGGHLNTNADTLDALLGTGAGGTFLPLSGGTVTGMANLTGGLTFQGGSNVPGSIYTDTNWGAIIMGRSGGLADVALQAHDGTAPIRVQAGNVVQFCGQLTTYSPISSQALSGAGLITPAINATVNLSGTSSYSGSSYKFTVGSATDTLASPPLSVFDLGLITNLNTGWQGSRGNLWAMISTAGNTDLTASNAAGAGAMVSINGAVNSNHNLGGVAAGYGTTQFGLGSQWGCVIQSFMQPGSTYYGICVGIEIDMAIYAGASAIWHTGLHVATYPQHSAQGTLIDAGIMINAEGPVKWRNGISIGSSQAVSIGPNGYYLRGVCGRDSSAAMTAAGGVDMLQPSFTGMGTAGGGFAFRAANYQVLNSGAAQIGPGLVSFDGNGLIIDAPYQQATAAVVAAGGTNFSVNDLLEGQDGSLVTATAIGAGGAVTTVAILRHGWARTGSLPTNPVTFTAQGRSGATMGSGCTLNLTWTPATRISLSPSGGQVLTNLTAAATDAAAATAGVPINGLYNNAGVVHVRLT